MTARSGSAILTSTGGITIPSINKPVSVAENTSQATNNFATTADIPAGSLIVVYAAAETANQGFTANGSQLTDGINSYSHVENSTPHGNVNALFYCINCKFVPSGTNFTWNSLTGSNPIVLGISYTIGANGGFDQSNEAFGSTASLALTWPTLAEGMEVVFGCMNHTAASSQTIDPNFIDLWPSATVTNIQFASRVVNSTAGGTWSTSWVDTTGGFPSYIALQASFKATPAPQVQSPAAALLAGAGSLTSNSTQNQVASALLAGAGSLTASANKTAAALFAGVGSLTVGEQVQSPAFALLAGIGSLASLAAEIQAGSALLAGVGSLSANAIAMKPGSALFAGTGGLTILATELQAAAALLAGAGSLTIVAAGGTIWQGNALFIGAGSLTVAEMLQSPAAALLSGIGSLKALATELQVASALFAGAGSLTASAVKPTAALFAGAGGLTVLATELQAAAALLAGVGSLTATASGPGATIWQGNALFAGIGVLSVTVTEIQTASMLLAGAGSLSASEVVQSPASALFAGAGSLTVLSGSTSQIIQAAALLAGTGSLSATMTGGSGGGPPGSGKSEWLVRARRRGRR